MTVRQRLSLVVILTALAGWSCSKSPTEPSPDYVLDINGVSSFYATFSTADGQPSILEFHALLDGKDIHSGTFATPVKSLDFAGTVFFARRGHHTLALRISAQTASPTVYRSDAIKVTLSSGPLTAPTHVATVILSEQTKSLLTGESIEIQFDI